MARPGEMEMCTAFMRPFNWRPINIKSDPHEVVLLGLSGDIRSSRGLHPNPGSSEQAMPPGLLRSLLGCPNKHVDMLDNSRRDRGDWQEES